MTNYAWPSTVIPNDITVEFVSNANRFVAPQTGIPSGQSRDAEVIRMSMAFKFLQGVSQTSGVATSTNARSTLMGYLAKLAGPEHRAVIPMFGLNNLGAWSGTPLVDGANQTGRQLSIDASGEGSVTAYGYAGDWFSVNGELKILTSNADLSLDNVTLDIWPPLRRSPDDNAAINTTAPTGIFMLEADPVWRFVPGPNGKPMGSLTVSFIEDPYL